MLYVKTPEQVLAMIQSEFSPLNEEERVPLRQALGRTLAEDIEAREYVPDFDRSTVDGYAVRAGIPLAVPMPFRRSCRYRLPFLWGKGRISP